MPTVQQQAPNLAGAYSVCGQASLPRAGVDEHNRSDVHQPLGGVGAVISLFPTFTIITIISHMLICFCGVQRVARWIVVFSSTLLHTLKQALGEENSQHVRDWAWTWCLISFCHIYLFLSLTPLDVK